MNPKTVDLKTLGTSLWVVILSCSTATAAHANQSAREARQLSGMSVGEWRAFRREMRPHLRGGQGNPISVPTPGEPINPPPSLENSIQQNFRANHLPGQVSLFRTARPDSLRRTSYINDAGRTRSIHSGVSLDLSSTDSTISIGSNLLGDSTVSIDVGGSTREIKSGSVVTAAEYAALNQKLLTGTQDLKLNDRGAAVDGSLNLNAVTDDGRAINTSAFVIPESVEVAGDFSRHADGIRIQNDLVNYGALYATSSNRKGTAIIRARDINNLEGGLISSDVSKSVASSLGISRSATNLAVRAERDLNNFGEISSSADLELSAGRTLNNSGNASARGTVSLNAPNINNSGTIAAQRGDLNIASPIDANLNINADGGEFLALRGDINVATSVGANPKTATTILGGSWQANNLNISSGEGRVIGEVDETDAMVNIKGGSAAFGSRHGELLLGALECSGDPLFFNLGGSVTIGSDQITGGNPLAIVAATDVNVGGGVTKLDTSSATGGGTITIVAGASLISNPGVTLTIQGGNIAGGNINLSGITTLTSSATGGNSNGGNINIIAFGAFGVGTVSIPSTSIIADGSGTGSGGSITVVGANNLGLAVNMQGAFNSLGSGKSGDIIIAAQDYDASPDVVIDASAAATQGAIISGAFVPGLNTTGSVQINNSIVTNGGNVTVRTNGAIDMQAIGTSGFSTNFSAGKIDISAASNVTVNGGLSAVGNGTGSGGAVNVTSSNAAVTLSGGATTTGGANGIGGNISVSASGDIFFSNLKSSGGATSGAAGAINVQNTGSNATIQIGAASILATSVSGAGGNVLLASTKGRLLFTNSTLIQTDGKTSSGNVGLTGTGTGSSGGVNSIANQTLTIDTNGGTVSGNVTFISDGSNGMSLPNTSLKVDSGRDISYDQLGATGINTGFTDAGSVTMVAGRDITGGNTKISTVPTGPSNAGGDVTLTVTGTGNLTVGAIDSSPSGFNFFPGVITLNSGTGLVILNGSLKSLTASQLGGSININSSSANLNLPQIDTAFLSVSTQGKLSTFGAISTVSTQLTTTTGNINIASSVTGNNGIILNAGGVITQTGSITANFLDISFNGAGNSNLTVSSPNSKGLNLQGTVPNGTLNLNIGNAGTLTIDTNMQSLSVTATGKISLLNATNVNSLVLQTNSGSDITIDGAITANLNGTIQLNVTAADITENGAGSLATSGTGSVSLIMNGGFGASAFLSGSNNINKLSVSGTATGSVVLNNGANAITIQSLGSVQDVDITTTDAVTGVVIGSNISTVGSLSFNTPRLFNDKNVQASSILIQNLAGDVALVGGALPGGVLTGTTPPAGAPGKPSSPTAINVVTKDGANLNLFGDMAFNGDVTLDNEFGTTNSNVGSLFHGNNNVLLKTTTWNTTGSQITGKNFIFQGSGKANIVNSTGAIDLNSDITLKGHDFAIVALTNITVSKAMTIDLSNDLGPGGTLTMLAGYEVTPAAKGQQQNANSYTFTGTASSGSIGASLLTINTSATSAGYNAGNVNVIANGGSVQLGDITADSVDGTSQISIVAETGVTVGNISAKTTGLGQTPSVFIRNGEAQVFGTPQLDNGTISGGAFGFDDFTGTYTAGNISLNKVTASIVSVKAGGTAANSIKLGNAITANSIELDAGKGDVELNFTNNLVATSYSDGTSPLISIFGGRLVGNPSKAITLTANGTIDGGTIQLQLQGSDPIVLGANAGEIQISATGPNNAGAVLVSTEGNLTVNTNGLNATGLNGFGAVHSLFSAGTLTINDTSVLSVNGTGANGKGGLLELNAADIVIPNNAANPAILTADASGTGNGGTILYSTDDTTPVFIGSPAKPVKGAVDFLNFSAKGGKTGGAGGFIDIDVAGSLFVDPTKATAVPQAGVSNGARFGFRSGTTLIVNGPLSADGLNGGAGGAIALISNSKTAFVVNNGGKTPKNGTSSTVSANGATGSINVSNFGGGLNIKSSLSADSLFLLSGLKGGIVASKGVVLTGSSSISLRSNDGVIGNKPLTISTPFLQVITNAGAKLIDTFAGLTVVDDSIVGKGGFTLTTSADTTLNDITATGGDISVTTSGTTLNVSAAAQITAQDGSITLNNSSVASGNINIFSQANIATSGKKGDDVVIAIGPVPKKGVNTTPPPGFDTDPQGKGRIFFDGNGTIVATGLGANPLVTAINKDVIFSNVTSGVGLITVETDTTITADPPIVEHTRNAAFSPVPPLVFGLKNTATNDIAVTNSAIPSADSIPTFEVSQVSSSNTNLFATVPSSNGTTGGTIDLANTNQVSNVFVNLLSCNAVPTVEQSAMEDSSVTRVASDMYIDAAFHGDVETMQSQFSVKRNAGIELAENSDGGKRFTLKNGNVLFAPKNDTTVETPHGTISIAANTVALVMQSTDRLAVFDVDDQSKDAIVVTTNGKRVSLSPGHNVVVSSHRSEQFEEVNPIELVQYRRLNKTVASNGWKVYTSEFSIPSACFAVKPLRHLSSSNDKSIAKMRSHMLKTNAVLMYLRPDQGDYVQYFKPQVTAMQ